MLTKVGVNTWGDEPNYTPQYIEHSIKDSFTRLGLDSIHAIIFHSLKTFSVDKVQEGFSYLLQCREKGLVTKVGLSLKTPRDLLYCAPFIRQIDIIEVNFNLLDMRLLDKEVQDIIRENDIEVVARTPFAFGFLTEEVDENYSFHESDHRKRWSSEQIHSWVSGRKDLKKYLKGTVFFNQFKF